MFALASGRFVPRCVLLALSLCAVVVPTARSQRASLSGVVTDSTGKPIADVEIRVTGGAVRTLSNEQGVYYLSEVIPGPATITAHRLGFRPFSTDVDLQAGKAHRVDIALLGSLDVLTGIAVVARRQAYESRLAGFNARRTLKVGHFVTRERIDRANSTVLSDMLREIPGVKIVHTQNLGKAVRLRGADCAPLVFVDGFPATAGEFDVDMIDLQSVEGIEVYNGLGSTPPEFAGPRDLDRCGVIAIWSRPSRAKLRASAVLDSLTRAERQSADAQVLTSDQVDVAARMDSASLPPSYPKALFAAGVTGRVVVEFVVDTAGGVDSSTIDVLQSSHPLFTMAVEASLAAAHFRAATLHGVKVRQYVQLPFTFGATADSRRPPSP